MKIITKTLQEKSILSPLFTTSPKNAGFWLPAITDASFGLPHVLERGKNEVGGVITTVSVKKERKSLFHNMGPLK